MNAESQRVEQLKKTHLELRENHQKTRQLPDSPERTRMLLSLGEQIEEVDREIQEIRGW